MAAKVDSRSPAIEALHADWVLTEALMAGTRAVRALGEKALPKWPNEEPESYDARLATATLFPAYRRTVSVMAGKPFATPVTFEKDVPAQIKAWCDDVDLEGVNLHAFAAEMFAEALAHGLAGILVEAPKPLPTGGRPATQAEQKAAGVRPYFVRVKHGEILGYRIERTPSGRRRLTQLRLREIASEPDGDFGEVEVERVRVLEPGRWTLWRKRSRANSLDSEWYVEDEGTTSLTEIPFVPLYGWREGFMCARPPLLDLAFLNVKHWQSQSDQDTITHVARVPILAIIGAESSTELTISAKQAVPIPLGGEMKWVEHGGEAIEAGRKSLSDLEDQMIQTGAELLVKKPGDRSATESANDAEGNKCDLQRIAEMFEDSLAQALYFMAKFASLDAGGHVSLFKDFGAATLSDASAQLIVSLQTAGVITRRTTINELKRRGVLAQDVDAEIEAAGVEEEGAALGEMTDDVEDDPPQDDPPQRKRSGKTGGGA